MDLYTPDATVIASAQNDVVRGETVWTPLLCGLYCTWRQKRIHECAFHLALGHHQFQDLLDRWLLSSEDQ
jgi:hypothetical protein